MHVLGKELLLVLVDNRNLWVGEPAEEVGGEELDFPKPAWDGLAELGDVESRDVSVKRAGEEEGQISVVKDWSDGDGGDRVERGDEFHLDAATLPVLMTPDNVQSVLLEWREGVYPLLRPARLPKCLEDLQ